MTNRESSDPYYDLIDDFDLIVSSFQDQYGIRISRDLRGMKWDEFRSLLVGIAPETVLGRIVAIRAEKDPKAVRQFTPEQRRIRNEWLQKKAKKVTSESRDAFLASMKMAFIAMAQKKEGK